MNAKKSIFNRGYIVYGLSDNVVVSEEYKKARESEEAGIIKKPVDVELRELKVRSEHIFAEKIRLLLFLVKNTAAGSNGLI